MTKATKAQSGKLGAVPAKTEPNARTANTLVMARVPGESGARTEARIRLHPVTGAAATVRQFDKPLAELDVAEIIGELSQHVIDVKAGDMSRPEEMLLAQAHTLDSIFHALARRAGANVGAHLGAAETYLRMALKAQAQCRSTLEALAEMKAPKNPTFIKQANIANQQQVNNGSATGANPRTEENIIHSNELITESTHESLDQNRTTAPIRANQGVKAVAALDRPAK